GSSSTSSPVVGNQATSTSFSLAGTHVDRLTGQGGAEMSRSVMFGDTRWRSRPRRHEERRLEERRHEERRHEEQTHGWYSSRGPGLRAASTPPDPVSQTTESEADVIDSPSTPSRARISASR